MIKEANDTTYFKITSHFGGQRDDYSNVIMIVESSSDLKNWKQIHKSNNYLELITWLSSMILLNELENNYHVLADYYISNQIVTKVFENKNHYKNQMRENGLKDEESELKDSERLEQDYCNECLLEEQEMLDEVISSQRLEIEKLTEIIQDLVITNLKLVELLGKK